jgi:CubicO group peptidase (beta-lactamase class C family)
MTRRAFRPIPGVSATILAAGLTGPAPVPAQVADRARIQSAVDSIVADALKGGRAAGMSIAVVRANDTLVLKGFGYADLEYDVPTPARAIYEIGSVTKQFTASAILLLAEQGKLSLDDELTKYLPNYPTHGQRLTIRRLMDHTSGIRGYTEMPGFGAIMTRRLARDSLVAMFASAPFDFPPGDALVYNNSAYFLLGLVIEKVSGGTYADFVKKNLFDKVGMPDSRYCDERAVIKRRAHGYDAGPLGLLVKGFIDHTWPFAAGSLCSTTGDLVAWTQALHGGRVLSAQSYEELITPGTLNDGTRLRYAKGLVVDSMGGHRVIQHGGGINGFLSDVAYFPDDQLTIVVLINTAGPVQPGPITNAIAGIVLGRREPKPAALDHPAADFVGDYKGVGRGDSLTVKVTTDTTGVRVQIGRGQPATARYAGNDIFMVGRNRLTFLREGSRVTRLRADLVSVVSMLRRS